MRIQVLPRIRLHSCIWCRCKPMRRFRNNPLQGHVKYKTEWNKLQKIYLAEVIRWTIRGTADTKLPNVFLVRRTVHARNSYTLDPTRPVIRYFNVQKVYRICFCALNYLFTVFLQFRYISSSTLLQRHISTWISIRTLANDAIVVQAGPVIQTRLIRALAVSLLAICPCKYAKFAK